MPRPLRIPLLLAAVSTVALAAGPVLKLKEMVPNKNERDVSGPSAFTKAQPPTADPRTVKGLVNYLAQYPGTTVTFKNEEPKRYAGDDQFMTAPTAAKIRVLNDLVAREWPGHHLRVTDAYDREGEHKSTSPHYDGRALDLTVATGTSGQGGKFDNSKLGRLGRLAVDAGFDWVWYENEVHVHVSNRQ